ncbi:hypothetical protein GZH53_06735 [Flavihumibacter sp. R14]|nr:hypothetical protein [Flavihumibacter soli]
MAVFAGEHGFTFVDFLKDFYQYDPQKNEWLRKADFPEAVILARGFATANTGYAGVGLTAESSTQVENKLNEYLPDKDIWNQKQVSRAFIAMALLHLASVINGA